MMSAEHSENGLVNQNDEECSQPDSTNPFLGTNSPRHSVTIETGVEEIKKEEPTIEFFDQKRRDNEGEGGVRGEDSSSPKQQRDKGTDSYNSRSYVVGSPPVSPGVAAALSASVNLFEEKVRKDDQSDLPQHSKLEDGDEVVKSKPALWEVSEGILSEGSAAAGRPLLLDEPSLDLKVSILRWEKVEEKESYIRYMICTQSSRLEKSEYVVWRRYKDFEWLREFTWKMHPTLIIPPLPGKQLSRYFDQKGEAFLAVRQRALQKFLQRVCVHPYFSFDKHLEVFLTADTEEFTAYVSDMTTTGRLFGAVTSSVKMAANSLRLKATDPEYVKAAKYFEDLGNKLSVVERIAARLHTEREELASDLDSFAMASLQWSLNERELVGPIQQTGVCVENCSNALKLLNENNAYSMLMTAKEYQLYCASAVSAVRRRDGLQLENDKAAEERENKKKVHDEAANAGKLQKLPRLADDLQKFGVEAERTLDELSVANEKLRVDMEKWREAKNRDIRHLMFHSADNHVQYHQKCFDEWAKVLSILRVPTPSSSFMPSSTALDLSSGAMGGRPLACHSLADSGGAVRNDAAIPTILASSEEHAGRSDSPSLFV